MHNGPQVFFSSLLLLLYATCVCSQHHTVPHMFFSEISISPVLICLSNNEDKEFLRTGVNKQNWNQSQNCWNPNNRNRAWAAAEDLAYVRHTHYQVIQGMGTLSYLQGVTTMCESDPLLTPLQLHPFVQIWSLLAPKITDGKYNLQINCSWKYSLVAAQQPGSKFTPPHYDK